MKNLVILFILLILTSCNKDFKETLSDCLDGITSNESEAQRAKKTSESSYQNAQIDSMLSETKKLHSEIDSLRAILSVVVESDGGDEGDSEVLPMAENSVDSVQEVQMDSVASVREEPVAIAQEDVYEIPDFDGEKEGKVTEGTTLIPKEKPAENPVVETVNEEDYSQEEQNSGWWGSIKKKGRAAFNKSKEFVQDHPKEVGIVAAAVATVAIPVVQKKLSCERYPIIDEYLMMVMCMNACEDDSGDATIAEVCANQITHWECQENLDKSEAKQRSNSCPLGH
ncbi:hypothetical protein SAMN05720468_11018 [Fibrobacter sp. UWEL]|nr:hypothetical protein SAMN05720468_11018 [Fibrobacter sp. UWEL]